MSWLIVLSVAQTLVQCKRIITVVAMSRRAREAVQEENSLSCRGTILGQIPGTARGHYGAPSQQEPLGIARCDPTLPQTDLSTYYTH